VNDHSDCFPADHMTCLVCGGEFCLAFFSDHRAAMYRLTPIHPECRVESLQEAA
jgi:hypothetical protein